MPGKFGLELLIIDWLFEWVTIPTVATPTGNNTEGTTLALNVLIPTKPSSVPYTDFTSDTEYSVIATATAHF